MLSVPSNSHFGSPFLFYFDDHYSDSEPGICDVAVMKPRFNLCYASTHSHTEHFRYLNELLFFQDVCTEFIGTTSFNKQICTN